MSASDTLSAASASAIPRTRKPATRRQKRDWLFAAGFLAPFMILLLVFQYVPLLVMARNSVYDYSLLNPAAAKKKS